MMITTMENMNNAMNTVQLQVQSSSIPMPLVGMIIVDATYVWYICNKDM